MNTPPLATPPVIKVAAQHTAVQCKIQRGSEKAILITRIGSLEPVWIPLSQVSYLGRGVAVDTTPLYPDVLHIAKWLINRLCEQRVTPSQSRDTDEDIGGKI